MWNEEMLTQIVDEAIVKKCQSLFGETTLVLLDVYGTHLKFVREKDEAYEKLNVLFKIFPARMTGLLQPLDVPASNRLMTTTTLNA